MPKTSPLAARLKRQMQTDSEIIRSLTREQLASLRKSLNAIMQRELNTIRTDMQDQSRKLAGRLIWSRTFWPLLIGLSISAGLLGGSWGMMHYLSRQIMTRQAIIATMEDNIQTLTAQGGKIQLITCGHRLCVQTDETAPSFQEGYRILKGY